MHIVHDFGEDVVLGRDFMERYKVTMNFMSGQLTIGGRSIPAWRNQNGKVSEKVISICQPPDQNIQRNKNNQLLLYQSPEPDSKECRKRDSKPESKTRDKQDNIMKYDSIQALPEPEPEVKITETNTLINDISKSDTVTLYKPRLGKGSTKVEQQEEQPYLSRRQPNLIVRTAPSKIQTDLILWKELLLNGGSVSPRSSSPAVIRMKPPDT
jgi:hypothetical protein